MISKLSQIDLIVLYKLYKIIESIWDNLDIKIDLKLLDKTDSDYIIIHQILIDCYLNKYTKFKNFIDNSLNIIKFNFENISFYYNFEDFEIYNNDIKMINILIKEIITLKKYFNCNQQNIVVIWIPINIKRDYKGDIINTTLLNKTTDKFKAFTASGLTFDFNNSRYTIISRYEEVHKLLFHELIHNFYIDGSNYHNDLKHVCKNYRNIKNSKNSKNNNYHYKYSIYESYTELISSYLNIIFYNILHNSHCNKIQIVQKIYSQIIIELLYSYNTVSNLIVLNNYKSYNDFIDNNYYFMGDICFYEYYFIKGLMYNFFKFNIVNIKEDYIKLYEQIILIMNNHTKDKLMINIFKNHFKQTNFKYLLYNI